MELDNAATRVSHQIVLCDQLCKAVKTIVQYAYTGRCRITSDNVCQLYLTARTLRAGPIMKWCTEFLIKKQVHLTLFI